MKTQLISSLPALKAVWSSALVLIFVLSSTLALLVLLPGCNQSPAVSGQSGSNALHSTDALHTAVSAVLDLEFPEERYAGLLSLHLQYPRAFSPVIYLAQIESAAGRITAAEEWLQAARESATRESAAAGGGAPAAAGDYETQLMWYLSARSAYERKENLKCLSYLDEMKGGAEAEKEIGKKAGGAFEVARKGQSRSGLSRPGQSRTAELFKFARVLKVRALIRGNRDSSPEDPKAVCDLLTLMLEGTPELLPDEVLLQGADICSSQERRKTASDLMLYYCRQRPFNPAYREFAAELCETCGLDTEAYLIRHEAAAFSQSGQEAPGNFDGADEKLQKAVHRFHTQQWHGAFELLHMLRAEGKLPRHRFADYMYAVCRLYSRPHERGAREKYTRLAALYGDEQLYFVHLYQAISPAGDLDAADSAALKLLEQSLRGCIAAGPHTELAAEARAHLARLAGLPPELKAEPLLKEEMQQLAEFVWEGGAPQLLQPLIEALEWPENRYSLEAGLLLRQLRAIPGVDAYIARRQELAGERGRERIRAILKF